METARVRRVAEETSDVLSTILLVGDDERLQDHLFAQLVDLLVEGMLADLHARLAHEELTPMQFCVEREALLEQCRAVGLGQ